MSDGGEVEKEKEQNIASENWFSNPHESGISQVSSLQICLSNGIFL